MKMLGNNYFKDKFVLVSNEDNLMGGNTFIITFFSHHYKPFMIWIKNSRLLEFDNADLSKEAIKQIKANIEVLRRFNYGF